MIYKLQRSIVTTNPTDIFVLYDEKREIWHEEPMTEQIKNLMGEEYKMFIDAEITEDGITVIGLLEDQGW